MVWRWLLLQFFLWGVTFLYYAKLESCICFRPTPCPGKHRDHPSHPHASCSYIVVILVFLVFCSSSCFLFHRLPSSPILPQQLLYSLSSHIAPLHPHPPHPLRATFSLLFLPHIFLPSSFPFSYMTPPIPLLTHPPQPLCLLLRMPHVTTSTSSSSPSRVFNPSPCVSELLCTSTYPTQGPHVCPTLPMQGAHALLYSGTPCPTLLGAY